MGWGFVYASDSVIHSLYFETHIHSGCSEPNPEFAGERAAWTMQISLNKPTPAHYCRSGKCQSYDGCLCVAL